MAKKNVKSVEEMVRRIYYKQWEEYDLDFKPGSTPLDNIEITQALSKYHSKSGGKGGNVPDVKLLLQDENSNYYPILIEFKGYEDKLVKLNDKSQVDNLTEKGEQKFNNIKNYAVNGAVHYSNAILEHTSFSNVIAIGITGHKDSSGEIKTQIGVYYVTKDNFGIGQEVGKYTDLSFLKKENFSKFTKKLNQLNFSEEQLLELRQKKDKEIQSVLTNLNNEIFKNVIGLSETERIYIISASIMATLGVPNKVVPLEKEHLKSFVDGETDGELIFNKITHFLTEKKIPERKRNLILNILKNTLYSDTINVPIDGESTLKKLFVKITEKLGIYYKLGITTDFTGKLFNEMYSWLRLPSDKNNDVVLTPIYVSKLLVKLARVDKDSFVWDFAAGSAGLLIAAMNEMLDDAKRNIESDEKLREKILEIKKDQLLGIELHKEVYMLAVLNMIMMGDGSSNILNEDSLKFNGKYSFNETDEQFPATAFVLNPPYSAEGNGMIFVEKALDMMNKGYAAIIIQGSAGSGKAKKFNINILKRNKLLASIKMPIDLFKGKSSVQTYIYVFRVGEKHDKDDVVRFIDFSNDGYERASRKKAKPSANLKDVDNAVARYQEVVDLVKFGEKKLKFLTTNEYYEGTIDPLNGCDWNQSNTSVKKPNLNDFKKTVGDYLEWQVSNLIKNSDVENKHSKK